MLDQIVNLVKDQGMDYFTNQTDVPNEQAGDAAKVAGESIFEGLQDQIMKGNISDVTNLLSGGASASGNPVTGAISGIFQNKLQEQLGIGGATASSASGAIPALLQSVMGKFSSPKPADSGFDVSSLIGMVSGGGQGGGGLTNMLQGAVKDQITKGIGDKIGNLFGK